jgi:protein-tyrosine-phosphatase
MTVHFAAARCSARSPIARALARKAVGRAANDNGDGMMGDDRLLHAALRHFAQHGLGAAHDARTRAQKAFFAGDRQAYDWWLGVCRTLDRRLAEQNSRRKSVQPDLIG